MQHWLLKTEPSTYSWADLMRDGRADWTGVRNYQARNNLRAMQVGDLAFIYHSVTGKCLLGIARIVEAAKPDATATDGDWVSVAIEPVAPLENEVSLERVKADGRLSGMALVANSRLSVQPVTLNEWKVCLELAKVSI